MLVLFWWRFQTSVAVAVNCRAARIIRHVEKIMVHAVGGGAAGVGVEIPAAQNGNRTASRPWADARRRWERWLKQLITVFAAGELFVGIENIQHARAVARVERRGI